MRSPGNPQSPGSSLVLPPSDGVTSGRLTFVSLGSLNCRAALLCRAGYVRGCVSNDLQLWGMNAWPHWVGRWWHEDSGYCSFAHQMPPSICGTVDLSLYS